MNFELGTNLAQASGLQGLKTGFSAASHPRLAYAMVKHSSSSLISALPPLERKTLSPSNLPVTVKFHLVTHRCSHCLSWQVCCGMSSFNQRSLLLVHLYVSSGTGQGQRFWVGLL